MTKYIDIHVLQTMPASNPNRGEDGLPKSVIYGGVNRARVSSQSWKRAMRQYFNRQVDQDDAQDAAWLDDMRSRYIPTIIAEELEKRGMDKDEAEDRACAVISNGVGGLTRDDSGKIRSTALVMLSKGQLDRLIDFAQTVQFEKTEKKSDKKSDPHTDATYKLPDKEAKKALKDLLKANNSLALSVFGRMVASDASLNVEAASQVAHAFSVNSLVPEFDYFAAVDDADDAVGAGMIDNFGFNASTYYRYANLNIDELKLNLDKDELVDKAIEYFIKAFVLSMPSGKQTSFANKTLPSYVQISIRDDTPVNLASAFEKPVKPDFVENGITRIEKELKNSELYVEKPAFTEVLTAEDSSLNKAKNLDGLVADTISNL